MLYAKSTSLCSVFALRGRKVMLPCVRPEVDAFAGQAGGDMSKHKYAWTDHLGRPPHESRMLVSEVGYLTINDVQPRDTGNWACAVTTGNSESPSHTRQTFNHHLMGR